MAVLLITTRSSSKTDTATRENYSTPSDRSGARVAATRYKAPDTGAAPPRRTHALYFSTHLKLRSCDKLPSAQLPQPTSTDALAIAAAGPTVLQHMSGRRALQYNGTDMRVIHLRLLISLISRSRARACDATPLFRVIDALLMRLIDAARPSHCPRPSH